MQKKNIFKRTIDIIVKIAIDIDDNRIATYAAQASFFVVISAVPLVMLILTVIQYYLPISKADFVGAAADFLPNELFNFASEIIDEIYSQISVSFTAVTAVTLLWSASRGIKAISMGIQEVYKSPKKRGYISTVLFSILYTVILIAIILASAAILIFGKNLAVVLLEFFPAISNLVKILYSIRMIIFAIVLTFIFAVAYRFLAVNEYKFRNHFPGALLASLGWIGFSYIYSVYIQNFSNFSYIYGSLAALIFMMLWLYFCMTILLLGAQFNVWIQQKTVFKRIKYRL